MDESKNNECWCYVTYAFKTDKIPPLPFPGQQGDISRYRQEDISMNIPRGELPADFQPLWYLNAKFPEDEE